MSFFEYSEGGSIREFCPKCGTMTIHKIGSDGKLYCSYCYLNLKILHAADSGLGGTIGKDWDATQSEEYKLKEMESRRKRLSMDTPDED